MTVTSRAQANVRSWELALNSALLVAARDRGGVHADLPEDSGGADALVKASRKLSAAEIKALSTSAVLALGPRTPRLYDPFVVQMMSWVLPAGWQPSTQQNTADFLRPYSLERAGYVAVTPEGVVVMGDFQGPGMVPGAIRADYPPGLLTAWYLPHPDGAVVVTCSYSWNEYEVDDLGPGWLEGALAFAASTSVGAALLESAEHAAWMKYAERTVREVPGLADDVASYVGIEGLTRSSALEAATGTAAPRALAGTAALLSILALTVTTTYGRPENLHIMALNRAGYAVLGPESLREWQALYDKGKGKLKEGVVDAPDKIRGVLDWMLDHPRIVVGTAAAAVVLGAASYLVGPGALRPLLSMASRKGV